MLAGIAFALAYSFMSFIFAWDEAVCGDDPDALVPNMYTNIGQSEG